MASAGLLWAAPVEAELPSGFTVVSGNANFEQQGTNLTITASERAIINYNRFNISKDHTVNIHSPLSLHRVTGGNASQILGRLNSPGKVFLINPSGIYMGPDAHIQVQSLTASTLDIKNQDFLADRYQFNAAPDQPTGTIINHGQINAQQDINLVGGAINNTGSLNAGQAVNLAVGDQVTFHAAPGVQMHVTVDKALQQKADMAQSAISNSGVIKGQAINAQARLAQSFYQATVNNSGVIEATGLTQTASGQIVAIANDGQSNLINTGQITAHGSINQPNGGLIRLEADTVINRGVVSADSGMGQGGVVKLLGNAVFNLDNGLVSANGATSGGHIYFGGDYLGQNPAIRNALFTKLGPSATLSATGGGGRIIAWSDQGTEIYGRIRVPAGFVETSGAHYLDITQAPDITGGGTWLLDPNDLTITSGVTQTNINASSPFVTTNNTSQLGVTLITNALASGNVIIATGSGGANSQSGNLTVSNAITYTGVGGRTLTLNAHGNLNLNAGITSTNALNINLNADSDTNGTGAFTANSAGTLTTSGGALTITGQSITTNSANITTTGGAVTMTSPGSIATGTGAISTTGGLVSLNGQSLNLTGTITTGNANADLISSSTIISTRPVLTGTGVVNVTAPTSTSFNHSVTTSPMQLGTINTPSLSLISSGASSGFTLANGYSGTSLSLNPQASGSNVVVNGNITTTGNTNIRANLANVTVNGNITDSSTTGGTILAAGSGTFSATTNLTLTGTINIASGTGKTLQVWDGDGTVFSNGWFTDGSARTFGTLDLRRADASGSFTTGNLSGLDLTSGNLALRTLGTNGLITLTNAFNGASLDLTSTGASAHITTANATTTGNLVLSGQSTTSANITTNNLNASGILDVRSYAGNVTINGTVQNYSSSSNSYLAAGFSSFNSTRNLTVTGALTMNPGASKTLTIMDGDGDIFNKAWFTDNTARLFNSLDFRRADTNGSFNLASLTGLSLPNTNLTLVTLGTNGHISLSNGFNGTNLTLQTQSTGSNVTVTGDIITSGLLDVRSYLGDVTVNGNVTNSSTAALVHYLAAGSSTFTSARNLTVTGALNIAGGASKQLSIYDGNGDIFNQSWFTDAGNRSFSLLDLRRGDTNGSLLLGNLTGLNTASLPASLTLVTLGNNGHISTPSSFTGTVLNLTASGTGANVTAGGNITASSTLTLQSATGNVTVNGNVNSTSTSGTMTLAAGSTTLTPGSNLTVTGSLAITGGTGKNLTVSDGDGDIFSKAFFASPFTVGTATYRSASNTNLGSLATPLTLSATAVVVQTGGNAYISDTSGTLNVQTTGSGIGGLFHLRGVGNITTNGAVQAGSVDWATTAGNGNIAMSQSVTATNGAVLSTQGTGGISVSSGRTLATTNAPISMTSNLVTLSGVNSITAGSGTVTIKPSNNLALTLNNTTKGSGFDLTATELGRITAGTLVFGDAAQTGGVSLANALNLSGTGLGKFNLTVANGGNYTTAYAITLGDKTLIINAGGTLNTAGISGTAGSAINLTATGSISTTGLLAADNLSLQADGISLGAGLNATQTTTLNSTGNVTQSAAISANALHLTGSGGSITLTNTANLVNTLTANRTGNTTYQNNGSLSLGAISTPNSTLTIDTNLGNLTVTQPISAGTAILTAQQHVIFDSNARVTATDAGTSLVLAAKTGHFTNNAATPPLSATNGRWLVYSDDPATTTAGNLTFAKLYNKTYAANLPGSISQTGNRLLYGLAPMITVTANNASRLYGQTNPAFSYTLSGFVDGDTVLTATTGLPNLSTLATLTSNAGNYAITPTAGSLGSDLGYGFNYTNGNLSVTQAPLTITANNASKVYGQANPTFTANYSGFVLGQDATSLGGSLSLTTSATAASNVGSYAITPSGLTSGNYALTFQDGSLSVNQAPLTITANNASKVYGQANPTFTANYSGFVLGQDVTSLGGSLSLTTSATAASNVGSYDITPSGLTSGNYALTFQDGSLSVNQAPLTITANNTSKVYGQANPSFSANYSGFVLGQDATALGGVLNLTTPATSSSNVGSYAITPSGLTSGNYVLTFQDGNLSVTQAPLTITANNASRIYGQANPSFSASYSGFVLGQDATALGGVLNLTTPANSSSNVGSYAITPSGLNSGNYALTFQDGNLSVTQAPLTITANNASRVYGQANPSFSANYSGFVLGQDATALGGVLNLTTPATNASNVGSYAITPSGLTSGNYALTFQDGSLSVDQAQLTITANNASRVYGQANPSFSANYSGFVLGQDATALGGVLNLTTPATSSSNVGSYTITPSGLSSGNYALTFQDGNLSVSQAPLTITANNASRLYGQANPNFSASYSGFVLGQDATALGGVLILTTPAVNTSKAGNYTITPTGLTSGNYAISFQDGQLTVLPVAESTTLPILSLQPNQTIPYLLNNQQNGYTFTLVQNTWLNEWNHRWRKLSTHRHCR